MPSIVILGSINMDLVCRTRVMPRAGETVLGDSFVTVPGGKGANQAVAAAKLAGKQTTVHMIGRVGGDDFGERLLSGLREHGVETRHVTVTESAASGVAMIVVDRRGENSIVVAAGANSRLSPADVDVARDTIAGASALVMQLEIPPATVRHAIALCQELRVPTILDPAPVPPKSLPRSMLGVDVLTPNEREAAALLGQTISTRRRTPDPKQIAGDLLRRGAKFVVLKLGGKGSLLVTRDGVMHSARPFKVRVVDTTAAGDAFTGALAVARSEKMEWSDALRFANAAGAICCTSFGAQPSLPSRDQVEALLRARH
jgi:ribokinase